MVERQIHQARRWPTYPAFSDPAARYSIGVDIGQRQDHSAIAVVRRTEITYNERDPVTYAFRREIRHTLMYLERLALGTEYHDVADRVAEVARFPELTGRCAIAIDATGVGMPVVELARAARPGCEVMAVQITAGGRETRSSGVYGVPKRDLIIGLQLMLEAGELQVAAGLPEANVLAEELRNMRVKVSLNGHESYEHWRSGDHDDLVLAVALGCWQAKKWRDVNGRVRLV